AGGALLMLVAAASAGVLAAHHLYGMALPGCGGGSPCDRAARSPWGTVPGVNWPVSFLGAAYFAGILVALLACPGRPTPGLRWLTRLGAAASVLFIGVMLSDGILCPYCLAAHVANLAFVALVELAAARPATGSARAPVMTGLCVAALVTAGLAIAK